jgi:hypothetical protein
VFLTGTDPVSLGLVTSFNHPGGNATGVSFVNSELDGKRLGLLHELLPRAKVIASLLDPSYPASASQLKDLHDAARRWHRQGRCKRETKGAVRLQEVGEDGTPAFAPSIGTLYIRKSALPDGKMPQTLTVTITI